MARPTGALELVGVVAGGVVGVVTGAVDSDGGLRMVLTAANVSAWRAAGNGAYPAGSCPTFSPGV